MGKIGLKMGVSAKLAVGIGSTKFASVAIVTELGPYIKLYGFFVYEYEKMRPANSTVWTYKERKAGALFLEFGAYFKLDFEASALKIFEYSHNFFDVEIPLLTAGERRYRYAFDYEPQPDEQVRVVDSNADSRDGITMKLADSLRAVSYVDLDTGVLGSEIYDYSDYNITLSNPNFTLDQDGKITVNVPTGVQYMACDLTLTWKYNKLAFSEYDMSVNIPLVWTNLSMSEQNQFFTASVRVGNAVDGYQTVWSQRVKKNQPFSLPTSGEVGKRINYDSYNISSDSNLKYSAVKGYGAQNTKDLAIYTDTVYDYDVTLKEYTVTVNGIQNADGTQVSKSYAVKYGDTFDFSDLSKTGTSIANTTYIKFADVTTDATISVVDKDGITVTQTVDLRQSVTGKTAVALGNGTNTATANYVDDSVVATFQFSGFEHADVTQKLKKNTSPNIAIIDTIAEEAGVMIEDIFPDLGKQTTSISYIVNCKSMPAGVKKTISFEENGGGQVVDILKATSSIIGALPEPIKTGYTFTGWYVDDKLTERFTQTKVPDHDITLYAKWTSNTYMVTLHSNGGAFAGDLNTTTVTVTYGESYGELPKPSQFGQNFAGWYTQANGGSLVSYVNIAQNHTLYAHWTLLYTVYAVNMQIDGLTSQVYDGTAKVVSVVSGSAICVTGSAIGVVTGRAIGSDVFTVEYKRNDASEWSDTAVNAGLYSIKVSLDTEKYTEYAPFEKTFVDVMIIDKHPSSFLLANNQLTGTIMGIGNIVVQELIPGVDYIGDGKIEYSVVRKDKLGFPNTWIWHDSNIIVNADANSGVTGEYVLTARMLDGENYTASELIVRQESSDPGANGWEPAVNTITMEPGISYRLDANNGYTYRVWIMTSDKVSAGTDADIYGGISSGYNAVTSSGNIGYFKLDNSGNDFERGDCDHYNLNTADGAGAFNAMLPMIFELFYIRKGSGADWHCSWIEVELYKNGQYMQTCSRVSVNLWFEDDGDTINIVKYIGSESEVTIPDKIEGKEVTTILENAFSEVTSIKKVIFGSCIIEVRSGAFRDCSNLEAVVMNEGITVLGDYAFSNTSLVSVDIPDTLESIGLSTFENNPKLTTLRFAGNAPLAFKTSFGKNLNTSLPVLKTIEIGKTATGFDSGWWSYTGLSKFFVIVESSKNTVASGEGIITGKAITLTAKDFKYKVKGKDLTITTYLGNYRDVIIPNTIDGNNVRYIGKAAFAGCDTLRSVQFGSNVFQIGESAFEDCKNLMYVQFNYGLKYIQTAAFQNTKIKKLVIPSTVKVINCFAFNNVSTVKSLIFYGNAPKIGGDTFGINWWGDPMPKLKKMDISKDASGFDSKFWLDRGLTDIASRMPTIVGLDMTKPEVLKTFDLKAETNSNIKK